MRHSRYVLVENSNGEWSVRLTARNGEPLATRESSALRSNARRAARAITKAAIEASKHPIEVLTLAEQRRRR